MSETSNRGYKLPQGRNYGAHGFEIDSPLQRHTGPGTPMGTNLNLAAYTAAENKRNVQQHQQAKAA